MLSDEELWQQVKRLRGRTICTITRRSENKILEVTEREVIIERRVTRPSRDFIVKVYHYLCRKGEVTGDDWKQICGNTYCGKVGRITLAILAEAVPDQIEVFVPAVRGKKSGIRKRQAY